MVQIVLFSISGTLSGDGVPCFTALRVKITTECWRAYATDAILEKSREHDF